MRSLVTLTVAASLALVAGPAHAHLDLLSPTPRTTMLKQGPCGAGPNDPRGPTVATYKPGETITITWNEYVDHPGHFRVAFDDDGQDIFVDPKGFDDISGGPGVIMDGIADKNGGDYSQEITLPDVECDNCVLQVIQVMTDKAPYGDGNDMYYQCADIALVGEVSATTGEPDTTTGAPGTTGGDEESTAGPDPSAGQTGGTAGESGEPVTGGETVSPTSDGGESSGSGGSDTDGLDGSTSDVATDGSDSDSGCGCRGGAGPGWLGLVLLPLLRRRRRA
jgi:hypothetical protein